jgi:hypothetical protein
MATIAKQENIRRSERIVAGLQRAKRNGSRLGATTSQQREGIENYTVAQNKTRRLKLLKRRDFHNGESEV